MTPDSPIPQDIPPHLNGDSSVEERLSALEAIAEGPPRLEDRLIRLERIVSANKLTAGEAGDAPHREMAREEATPLVAAAETKQAGVNTEFRTAIANLLRGLHDLEARSLTLFALICIVGAMSLYAVIWTIHEVFA